MPCRRLLSARGGDVMAAPTATTELPDVKLTIDQREVVVPAGTTIFDAARISGFPFQPSVISRTKPQWVFAGLCVVDIGQRVYAASCVRQVEPGMVVKTATEDVAGVQRTLLELLMADHPTPCQRQQLTHDCELEQPGKPRPALTASRYPGLPSPRGHDESSASIAVDHDACILVRALHPRLQRDSPQLRLGPRGKGYQAGIAFDENLPMGNSTCVSCGECMVSCPTGALVNKKKEIAHQAFR